MAFTLPTFAQRTEAMQDTFDRCLGLLEDKFCDEEADIWPFSVFFDHELSVEESQPGKKPVSVTIDGRVIQPTHHVIAGDMLAVLRDHHRRGLLKGLEKEVVVLNPANATIPGNDVAQKSGIGEEERLCYPSTLTMSLFSQRYPWNARLDSREINGTAALWTEYAWVFKAELTRGFADLPEEECIATSFVSVPTPVGVRIENGDFATAADLRKYKSRIMMIYRMAKKHEKSILYLSPFGCAEPCKIPANKIAEMMLSCLQEPEFAGYFQRVVWVIRTQREMAVFASMIESSPMSQPPSSTATVSSAIDAANDEHDGESGMISGSHEAMSMAERNDDTEDAKLNDDDLIEDASWLTRLALTFF